MPPSSENSRFFRTDLTIPPDISPRLRALIDDTIERMPDGPVLVAASGGPDSTALAVIAAERGNATLGHVNHHLVLEADAFEEAVRSLGHRLSLPVRVEHLDPQSIVGGAAGLEAEARALRYRALATMSPHPILTAHTAHDRLDTILMRLVQGTGVDALDGPRERTEIAGRSIVRPMLRWFEEDVADLLAHLGIDPTSDPGNTDPERLRNRIRPSARALCEVADRDTLARSLDAIATDAVRLRRHDVRMLDSLSRDVEGEIWLAGPAFSRLDVTERATVAHQALRRLGVRASRRFCLRIAAISRGESTRAHGVVVEHAEYVVRIAKSDRETLDPIAVDVPLALDQRRIVTPLGELVIGERAQDAEVWIDPSTIDGNLRVRTLRPEDRFVPVGRTHEVAVVDRLKRDAIPVAVRRATLVIADESGPLWIVGGRRAERTTVANSADRIALRWHSWDG